MESILSTLHPLKSASAAEIIIRIEELAEELKGFATPITAILNPGGNGNSQIFPPNLTESRVVKVALLALLADEISYAPTAPQRLAQLAEIESASRRMNIYYEDVLRFSRHSAKLTAIFDKSPL